MTKQTCITLDFITTILAMLVFLFYPIKSSFLGSLNYIDILRQFASSQPALLIGVGVYILSFLLMAAAQFNQNVNNAGPLLIWSMVFPTLLFILAFIDIKGDITEFFKAGAYYVLLLSFWIVQIILVIVFYNAKDGRQATAPPVTQPKEEEEKVVEITSGDREEYATALSLKSEEELKKLVHNAKMYEAVFVALVREELTERMLGRRKQMTEEEARLAQERRLEEKKQQQLEEEKQRQEEEERKRKKELQQNRITLWWLMIVFAAVVIFYLISIYT